MNSNKGRTLSVFMLFIAFPFMIQATECRIVKEGQTLARIIVAETAPLSVKLASKELQAYIKKISGAELQIIEINDRTPLNIENLQQNAGLVLLGESRYTKELGVSADNLKSGGYLIRTFDNALVILGRDWGNISSAAEAPADSTGTLYGVYGLLYHLGVRWYYPCDLGEVIPNLRDITIKDMNVKNEPYFRMRTAFGISKGVASWHSDGLWQRRLGMGTDLSPGSPHPFTCWEYKFKGKHDEYFAIFSGKQNYGSICFSNPAARQEMIRAARNRYLASPYEHKTKPFFTVLNNDCSMRSCECSECAKKLDNTRGWSGTDSNLITEAAVDIAGTISEEFPEAVIMLAAYQKSNQPPTNIQKLPANVGVAVAKDNCLQQWSDLYCKNSKCIIDNWAALNPKFMYFWEYYGHAAGSFIVAPHFIKRDIDYLKLIKEKQQIDIIGKYIFTDAPDNASLQKRIPWFGLNYYVTAKCLWNPDTDIDKLLDEYYEKFYGPAEQPMKQFFTLAEEIWTRPDHGIKWEYGEKTVDPQLLERRWSPKMTQLVDFPLTVLFKSEDFKMLEELLCEAIKKTGKDNIYEQRVNFVKDSFEHTRTTWRKQSELADSSKTEPLVLSEIKEDLPVDENIDGLWKDKSESIDFRTLNDASLLDYGTQAYISYNKKFLYLAFFCKRLPGTPLIAQSRPDDDEPWKDESIEIFISPNIEKPEKYYHIVVNSNGNVADIDPTGRTMWNSKIKVTIKKLDNAWILTAAIPFNSFERFPDKGSRWKIGLYRNRRYSNDVERQAAFPTFSFSYHDFRRFGELYFAGMTDTKIDSVFEWNSSDKDSKGISMGSGAIFSPEGLFFNNPNSFADAGTLNLSGNTKAFTVSVSFKIVNELNRGCNTLASLKKTWNEDQGFYLGLRKEQIELNAAGTRLIKANNIRFNNGWNEITGVFIGDEKSSFAKIYLNGELAASGTSGPLVFRGNRLYIGCCSPGINGFSGIIRSVKIYQRPLSFMEIKRYQNPD